jgi:hypothetical protein
MILIKEILFKNIIKINLPNTIKFDNIFYLKVHA